MLSVALEIAPGTAPRIPAKYNMGKKAGGEEETSQARWKGRRMPKGRGPLQGEQRGLPLGAGRSTLRQEESLMLLSTHRAPDCTRCLTYTRMLPQFPQQQTVSD